MTRTILERIRAGEVSLQFRRWARPSVRAGGTLRTAVGVIAIETVDTIPLAGITADEAHSAGFGTRAELVEALSRRPGQVYRIGLRWTGEDARIALRRSAAGLEVIAAELDGIDRRSRRGPWTQQTLRILARSPGTPAAALADELGRERLAFKQDVRRLKDLGLTESLTVGYRLSPRGRALLAHTDPD